MKQDKFEHIVKNSLESFEPEVPTHLWDNIRNQITSPQAGQPAAESAAGNAGAAGAGTSALVKIGAAALVLIGGGLIVWQLYSDSPREIAEKQEVVQETTTTSAEKASEKIPADLVIEKEEPKNEGNKAQIESNSQSATETRSSFVEAETTTQHSDNAIQTEDKSSAASTLQLEKVEEASSEESGEQAATPVRETPVTEENPKATTNTNVQTENAGVEEVIEDVNEQEEVYFVAEAGILASAVRGERPLQVEFKNVTEAASYEWNFGNNEYSSNAEPSVTFDEPGDYTVRLTITDANGNRMTDQMDISVYSLYLPNIFTPNNDGTNDTYVIKGSNVTNVSFSIYRIDGSLVFEGHGMQAEWDGSDTREPHAENYLVIATATLQDGSEVVKKATLTVRRN